MTLPKAFAFIAAILFGTILVASLFKGSKRPVVTDTSTPVEIVFTEVSLPEVKAPKEKLKAPPSPPVEPRTNPPSMKDLPEANRVNEFFSKRGDKFPIVETVTYKSRVDWLPGRPAWLADYASHYNTSRHFIARSLNGRGDYFKQDVSEGDRFNVFAPEKEISFHLLIDLSRSKMWFYYLDNGTKERVLVKTYDVSLGRPDSSTSSGLLTPVGKYTLGEKIGIYKPNKMGLYNGQKTEMITVFGSRWLPFEEEIGDCSDGARGLGIHGLPWTPNDAGVLSENPSLIGKYESDGCIRMATSDVEELFAIVITKPTVVELVKDFHDATLPGVENKPRA